MNIYRIGPPDEHPELTELTPPFSVDAVLLATPENTLTYDEQALLTLYRRYGRPILTAPQETASEQRTNYAPINCGYYDNFEAAIVQRRTVELDYLLADGTSATMKTRLRDLKTQQTEEFVQLADGKWIRLDRIVALDGKAAGESCSF